jgi:hypothetical protein
MRAPKKCATKILCPPPKTHFASHPRSRVLLAIPSCQLSSALSMHHLLGGEKPRFGPRHSEVDKWPSEQMPQTRSYLALHLRPGSVHSQGRSSETSPMHSFDSECPFFVRPHTLMCVRSECLQISRAIAVPSAAEIMAFKDSSQVALKPALRRIFCWSSNPYFQSSPLPVVGGICLQFRRQRHLPR